ncbi:HIT domain-containing protein [Candidatus Omnitrophota bacterium]
MDKLWAPWRIGYVKSAGKKKAGCLFCRSLNSAKKNYVFIRNKYSFAMLNLFPYNNGHVMVSPNRHTGNLKDLSNREMSDIFKTLRLVMGLLDKVLKPQGYNLGMNIGKCGGAGIPGHLHLHIVPRWQADTNFMPVISGTKIVSQSLEELYRQLKGNVKSKQNKGIRR